MEDYTRQILTTIRESNNLNENETPNESVQPNDFDYQEEVKKFKSQISSRVEITQFSIYPTTKNVIFGGVFSDIHNLKFQFSLEEKDGLYINADALKLDDDAVERLNKLSGYYKNWADEWANKVISNYANQTM